MRDMRPAFLALLLASVAPAACHAPGDAERASALLLRGRVLRGDAGGRVTPAEASAVAIRDGRIAAIGDLDACVAALGGTPYEVIDAGDALVARGFFDAHAHLMNGGAQLLELDLRGCRSEAELLERVAERAATLPEGAWVRGRGFDQSLFPRQAWPTRSGLDRIVPGRLVFLTRVDGHAALASGAALALAGIDASTPDPMNGVIGRGADGKPDGILKEGATELVARLIPPYTRTEKKEGARLALAQAARLGITSITDHGGDPEIYRELLEEGALTARVDVWLDLDGDLERARAIRARFLPLRDHIRVETLKGFVDGTFGSRTAAMHEPFHDDADTRGVLVTDPRVLMERVLAADAAGFQVALHAIGDRAVSIALDSFEEARARNPDGPAHRIEHVQVLRPEDAPRFRTLRVTASVQPCHLLSDRRFALDRLGSARLRYAYPYRTLRDAGALLAIGTDFPVEPLDPRRNLFAAVARGDEEDANAAPLVPEQALTCEETLWSMTIGPAMATGRDAELGALAPGSRADLVVLDVPWTPRDPRAFLAARVLLTVADGRIVYRAP